MVKDMAYVVPLHRVFWKHDAIAMTNESNAKRHFSHVYAASEQFEKRPRPPLRDSVQCQVELTNHTAVILFW